jgi:hypothetical protein
LVIAALVPLCLFTFSGNVILPYALPALPPAALALVALLAPAEGEALRLRMRTFAIVGAVPIVALAALVPINAAFIDAHTQRPVIRAIEARHPLLPLPIFYWQERHFSAEYYSHGRATAVTDTQAIERALAARHEFSLVVAERNRTSVPEAINAQLAEVTALGGFVVLEPRYSYTAAPERS